MVVLFDTTESVQSRLGGQKWTYNSIVKDKALRLLLPGLVFSLVALVVKLVFPGEMSRQAGLSLQEVAHAYLYPYDNPMRELWFIVTLFWLMMLAPLWRYLLNTNWKKWTALILLVILHFWHSNIGFFCLGRVFGHAIWFYLGLLISEMDYVDKYMVKQPWLVLFSGIAIYVVGKFIDPFVSTVGGITLSFGLALILDKYLAKVFFTFRNYTYQIFLMGIFAQIAVKIAYRHLGLPYVGTFILCIIAGLYVPVLTSKALEWINWKPMLISVGLKIKKTK